MTKVITKKRQRSKANNHSHSPEKAPQGLLELAILPLFIFFFSYSFLISDFNPQEKPIFDEYHYISAGRQIIQAGVNENWSHPPLAKAFIGVGMKIFGDNPFGWRFMSLVFGSLTLVAMYFWGLALFRKTSSALFLVFLTLTNQLFFVFSRTAMLDPFMFCFMTIAFALVSHSIVTPNKNSPPDKRLTVLGGIALGLACNCKWFGIIGLLPCCWILLRKLGNSKPFKPIQVARFLLVPAILSYLLSFALMAKMQIPLKPDTTAQEKNKDQITWTDKKSDQSHQTTQATSLPQGSSSKAKESQIPLATVPTKYGFAGLIPLQIKMLEAQLKFQNPNHIGQSHWFTWPVMSCPVWFDLPTVEKQPETAAMMVHGIAFLGNPAIIWGGLLAMIVCLLAWKRTRSKEAEIILSFYFSLFFSWVLIPRHTSFFYYYYPASMVLGLALVYAFEYFKRSPFFKSGFSLLCLVLFVYFKPILSGQPLPEKTFDQRLWFKSWLWCNDQRPKK